jgi:hypothetical protein
MTTGKVAGRGAAFSADGGVHHSVVHERDGAVYGATNHFASGPTVPRSKDGGKTSNRSQLVRLADASGLTVNPTWHVEPGRRWEPGTFTWKERADGGL